MFRCRFGFTTIIAVTVVAPAASADERGITSRGTAEIEVAPDEVVITFGVETEHKELTEAKELNDTRTAAVIGAVKQLGVPAEKIATEYLRITPRYNSYRDFDKYEVRRTVVVTLNRVDQFEALLSAALLAGATHVHDVVFQTTNLREHRDKARLMAVRAAREKAEAVAAELGQQIGRPLTISEEADRWAGSYSGWGWSFGQFAASNSTLSIPGDGDPIQTKAFAPGQIKVVARVSVTFELDDAGLPVPAQR